MTSRKKILEIVTIIVLAAVLIGSGFWAGWAEGRKYPTNLVVTGATNIVPPSSTGLAAGGASSTPADFATFWQAWQTINDNYLRNASTTGVQKVQGAIGGLVQSLGDPYSEYFDPQDNQQFQQDVSGNFGGIGAELGENAQGQLVVIAPLPNTPASRAGFKADDQILAVNGSSTDGMSVDAAVNLIRGDVGTKVTLTLMRTTWTKTQDFTLTREDIAVPTVDFEMKGNLAHISLHEFTADADQTFYNALTKAMDQNAKGIVLDLRDDPGGYLEVAVDISGYFLKPGTLVVSEADRNGTSTTYTASGNGALANVPMAILINGGSASAAEILAGALHDDRQIPLVGEKSFGKGTVQTLEPLADGSAIKLTIAHWVLPSGRILDHDGLVPDYPVAEPTSTATTTPDVQLNKALQVLQSELAK
jgi:carboxyl-terminal processing protease